MMAGRQERNRSSKGQSCLEFMLLLAAALAVILLVVIVSQSQVGTISSFKEEQEAKNAVSDLSSAAREVYAQGEGARKKVYLKIPSGYEPAFSSVGNNSIRLRARGTDYVSEESFEIYGALPGKSGGHWLWVVSEGNRVRVGSFMFSLSRTSIFLIMDRNSSSGMSFSVKNVAGDNISVQTNLRWNHTNMIVTTSNGSFVLPPGQSGGVGLDFTANENASGFYNGFIDVTSTDGVNNVTVTLPITIEVVGYGSGIAPPLAIFPSLWNISLMPGDNVSKEFTVCTNGETAPDAVTFTPSPGPPGSWVGNTDALGPMAVDTCQQKVLTLGVPGGTTGGVYTGSVRATGMGVEDAEDTISLFITVGGDPEDTEGPWVYYFEAYPERIYEDDPILVMARADDTLNGNNSIKECQVRFDSGAWYYMSPNDGAFDSPVENVSYLHFPGMEDKGLHNATIRCTDAKDNIGPEYRSPFKVMKEMLFVTDSCTSSLGCLIACLWSSEACWASWLWAHNSFLGYRWNMETSRFSDVTSGSTDLSYYSSVIMAGYPSSGGPDATLINYTGGGGRVVFLGRANQYGPRQVGLTTSSGSYTSEEDIEIVDNTHFITEDFGNATYSIYYSNNRVYGVGSDFDGTQYAVSDSVPTRTVLGFEDGFLIWGAYKPYSLDSDGHLLSVNAVDWAIDNSTIH